MAVVAIDFKARCKSREERFEAWADEECGGVSFDEHRDPTLYGVEDVGEWHGLAHIQLISPVLELRDETGHMAWTWYGLLAEPRIGSLDPRIDRLAVRLRANGIGLLNLRRGFVSPEHTALIFFVRSNKRAWPIAPALFGHLNAYEYANCFVRPPLGGLPLIRGVPLQFRDDDTEKEHLRMLSLFSLT